MSSPGRKLRTELSDRLRRARNISATFLRPPSGTGCPHALHGRPDTCSQCLIDPRFVARAAPSVADQIRELTSPRSNARERRKLGL